MVIIGGKVIRGDGFGSELGYPTANLDRKEFVRKNLKVRLGVYAGWAILASGKKYPAAIVIGPLDKRSLPKIESHLIGFKGNLYGKKIFVELKKYLRPFKKFKNIEALKLQILHDVEKVKDVLK